MDLSPHQKSILKLLKMEDGLHYVHISDMLGIDDQEAARLLIQMDREEYISFNGIEAYLLPKGIKRIKDGIVIS